MNEMCVVFREHLENVVGFAKETQHKGTILWVNRLTQEADSGAFCSLGDNLLLFKSINEIQRSRDMKKLCLILAFVLLLGGCGKKSVQAQITQPAANVADSADKGNDGQGKENTESRWVSFDIYAINDLHGKLADTEFQPGVDELSTYLKNAQHRGNTILLSTGDMWQGTSESNSTKGFLVTEWMNAMDFAAMTVGGHEFDWGEDWIRQNRQLAEFPFLGINVYSRETDQRVDYCDSSRVVEMDGLQIGIIGAIGNCYSSISSENTENIYFVNGAELTNLVKAESEKLRSEGVDFIIYAIHDGYDKTSPGTGAMSVTGRDLESYYDTVLSAGYVDVVFEADTHFSYVLQDQQGVYHLQNGGNNNGISHARVMFDKKNGTAEVVTAELVASTAYSYLEDDPIVAELLEKYAQQIEPATRTLGINGQYRNNYHLSQLVAKLYCEKGVEKWGAEYDIVLGGGYISCRSPGYLPEGEVSYDQLQSLLPFDNQITLCSIQGRDLISKFLETSNEAYHIQTTAYGERIRDSIDPDGIYYVVTDSYSANYSYNNMTVVKTYAADIFARDLLAAYIAEGKMA